MMSYNGNQIHLTKYLTNIAIDPLTGQALSSDGAPTANYTLSTNLARPIIGFKVPQGAQFVIDSNPWVMMKFYTDNAGTTQIAGGDTISMWSKAPYEPKESMGTFIASVKYMPWANVDFTQQGMGQRAARLVFPIDQAFTLPENFILIITVATQLASETFDWTMSDIDIPATQVTKY